MGVSTHSNTIQFDAEVPGVDSADAWRAVAQLLPDTIVAVDRNGIICWINRTLPQYRRAEVIGRHCAEFSTEEAKAKYMHVLDDVFRGETPVPYEAQTLDGRWWLIRAIPVRDAHGDITTAVFICSDVTEKRLSNESLARHEAQFRLMADTSPAVTFVYDLDAEQTIYVNSRVHQMLGYTPEEVIKLGAEFASNAIFPADAEQVAEHVGALRMMKDGEVREQEYRLRRKDGEIRWVITRSTPFSRRSDGHVHLTLCSTIDITEQRRVAEALEENRNLLNHILSDSPAITYVWDTSTLRTVYVNGQTERILGRSPSEFLKSLDELFSDWIHADDHARLQSALDQVRLAADGETLDCEHRALHRDGNWRWLLNRMSVLRRGEDGSALSVIGLVFDTTERHQAQQALRASEAGLRSVMKHAPDLIARLDARGRIVYSNRNGDDNQHCRLTETNAFAWTIPDDAFILRDVLNAVFTEGRTMQTRLRVHRPDGAERSYDCNFGPIVVNDVVESAIVVSRDVTDELRAADLLRQKESQLAHATRLSTSVGMLAGISHEVNQPLYAITNFAAAARQTLEGEVGEKVAQVRSWLDQINEQADRAANIIRTLRQLVRNEEPRRELQNVNLLLRDCVRLCEVQARDARVRIASHESDVPLHCLVDRVQIEQTLMNLLRNAIESMSATDIADRTIRVAATCDNDWAIISVLDRGHGLPRGDEDRVFEPFYSTKTEGLGLGLAICRNIVESHFGRIWAMPNVGPGCTFLVALPLVGAARHVP